MHAEVGPAYGRPREAFEDTRERAAGITGTLRIGLYTPLSAGRHMVEIVRAFTARYPACEVVFVNTGLNENPLSWGAPAGSICSRPGCRSSNPISRSGRFSTRAARLAHLA